MNESTRLKELGIATALLADMTSQWLPKALALEAKVGRGEPLNDFDIAFLKEGFHSLQQTRNLVDHHPEFQDLYGRVTALLEGITEAGLDNERKPAPAVAGSSYP